MDNEKLLEIVLEKLTLIDNELKTLNSTSAVQTEQLREHIRRTNLLEERVELERQKTDLQLAPALKMTQALNTGFKLVGAIVAGIVGIAGFTATILTIIRLFQK